MELKGKNVLVVGFGRTGEACCRFLLRKGAKVKVSEKKKLDELGQGLDFWRAQGVEFKTGGHSLPSFLEADLIVTSPGVPSIPELKAAEEKAIPVLSELELAYRFLKGKIVGITGTNGKSTTATLTHKIIQEAGYEAFLTGNIGNPLINLAGESRDDHVYVTEISSFQLEHIDTFNVDVSVFLNISPDHLDWHPSFTEYFEAKKKLVLMQKKGAKTILNYDDPLVWPLKEEALSEVFGFSRKKEVFPGCFLDGETLIFSNEQREEFMSTSDIPLFGVHNQENVMASALVGHSFGIPLAQMRKSIMSFRGLEHRLEKVTTINGVDFYNDSKATNVDATLKSVQSFDRRIILILGGRDKGGDFTKLKNEIKKKVKKIILIGEAKVKIRHALTGRAEFLDASTLQEAVRIGFSEAAPGEVVLLAPACTSFDLFHNFEERGNVFKREVYELEKSIKNESR